jgi:predicted enzyme related to lactoylglutathione lyase
MAAMNQPGYFELQADDPARAAAFYGAIFGWEIVRDEAMPIEYWRIDTRGGIEGAILKRPAASPPERSGTNAAVISIRVESYDATADAIHRNGGLDALAKFAVPGRCWQGYFLDTEGNTFGLFEVDPNAR